MNRRPSIGRELLCVLAVSTTLLACSQEAPPSAATGRAECRSEFGVYEGCGGAYFNEWVTRSEYIETRDGTRLAADISIPATGGRAVAERFPVLWTYTRYHRRSGAEPDIEESAKLQRLVENGYVVVVVNVRGGGASFGRYEGLFSKVETADAFDVMEWLSNQPFSNGKLGMFGGSYLGITQYMAASTHHPALLAIMPEVGYFDFFDALRRGGILREDQVRNWADGTRFLDKEKSPAPVDADIDGTLAAQAVAEHETNFDPTVPLAEAEFRDSTANEFDWVSDMPRVVYDEVEASGIPIYHVGAWHDAYTTDTLLLEANYPGTDRLLMGPWAHDPTSELERQEYQRVITSETLRWYDHWLKGIATGILDEPEMQVAVIDTPRRSWQWMTLAALPEDRIQFFLGSQLETSTVELPGDFELLLEPSEEERGLSYQVDLQTTTGTKTRWDANFGGVADYPDMSGNDALALAFTSAPLEEDLIVLGAPVANILLSVSERDTDVYVLLEEVDEAGFSHYASEGMLRASLREEAQAPWENNLGLPWHRAFAEDREPLIPGRTVELRIPMQPTGHRFNEGSRIRIVLMGADKDNTEEPPFPDAEWTVLAGKGGSRVSLPVYSD